MKAICRNRTDEKGTLRRVRLLTSASQSQIAATTMTMTLFDGFVLCPRSSTVLKIVDIVSSQIIISKYITDCAPIATEIRPEARSPNAMKTA